MRKERVGIGVGGESMWASNLYSRLLFTDVCQQVLTCQRPSSHDHISMCLLNYPTHCDIRMLEF